MLDREGMVLDKAEEIAEQRYCRPFCQLPKDIQYRVFSEAEQEVTDYFAVKADLQADAEKEQVGRSRK